MPFKYDYSGVLEKTLDKLYKKDRKRYEIVLKKVEEIISRDNFTIDFYKNLRHDLSDQKRVHIDRSFVLFFKVFKKDNFIFFEKLEHHDDAYKR